jgi:hypothetical protein
LQRNETALAVDAIAYNNKAFLSQASRGRLVDEIACKPD